MKLDSNTVLVTGGASGIGLAIAEKFLRAGSEVIICGRREDKLREVQEKFPQIKIRACDLAQTTERHSLFDWVTEKFPRLNILVNNAGIQRRIKITEAEDWEQTQPEILINLAAPVHLSMLFARFFLKQQNPFIINVTSGLSFVPLANVPVYCATKAALHSFTLSLRQQLSDTAIKVIEIIPPAVDTDLGGAGLHTFGVSLPEFTTAVIKRLETGDLEIAYGTAEKSSQASRSELNQIFERMNQPVA